MTRGQGDLFPPPDAPPLANVDPLIRFPGSKRWLVPFVRDGIWAHLAFSSGAGARFIEPFAGSMAVGLAIGWPDTVEGDLAGGLIEMYQAVAAAPDEVAAQIASVASPAASFVGEVGYYALRATYNAGASNGAASPRRAAMLLALTERSFNGVYRVNRSGGFNVPVGRRADGSLIDPTFPTVEELARIAAVAARWRFVCGDFQQLIDEARSGDCVFADPPYADLDAVRSSRMFTGYTAGGFAPGDQVRLADALARARDRGVVVVHTNSCTQAVRQLYRDRGFFAIPTAESRAVNRDGAGRRRVKCLLVLSHPEVLRVREEDP